jgi:hypothetical protein
MKVLNASEVEQFVEQGFVTIRDCVSAEVIVDWREWCFNRLGTTEAAAQSILRGQEELPPVLSVDSALLAPRAYSAACDLVGGPEMLAGKWLWTDGFLVNSNPESDQPWTVPPPASESWHLDTHWYRCFLDSPEWAILCIVGWSDIGRHEGATVVSPSSAKRVARYLYEHPEGVTGWPIQALLGDNPDYKELEMAAGDVTFVSRHLVHTASPNLGPRPRIITRPALTLREPLRLGAGAGGRSPLEQMTLRALGEVAADFQPRGGREALKYPHWEFYEMKSRTARESLKLRLDGAVE